MSEEIYPMSQCLMEKVKEKHRVRKIAWIPSIRANVGSKVKIKDIEGVWTILERYATSPSDEVIANGSDYRNHRKATDI